MRRTLGALAVIGGLLAAVPSLVAAAEGAPFGSDPVRELLRAEATICTWSGDLPDTTAAPYGAVGFISNGCTATLIDSRHILTAAHCIINEGDASNYWANMWFYPNFNGNEASPPRYRIQRAVVGSHGETCCQYVTSDWAIARLEAAVEGFPSIPVNATAYDGARVTVGHYTRDGAYFEPDCATPPYAGELGCTPGWPNWFGNAWWQNGLTSEGTVTLNVDLAYNVTTAPGWGGASGSPHLVEPVTGIWRVNGVTHGAGCDGTQGPWAGRFVNAPRFAANVGVASATSSAARTGVFVVDTDARRLVYRERTVTDGSAPFEFYRYAKTLPAGTFTRIAAFKLGGTGFPGVVVLGSTGVLREADWSAGWSAWKTVSAPPLGVVRDVDAAYNKAGVNSLYAVTNSGGGHVYRRRRTSGVAGAPWRAAWDHVVANDPYTYVRVTALRHHGDGLNQVWALGSTGVIRTVREGARGGWTKVSSVAAPIARVGGRVVDVDAGWNAQQRAMLVALMSDGQAWYREANSTRSTATWSAWKRLPSVVDPGVPVNRGGVRLASVTASRFAETRGGAVVPVVFATDTWGNVYQTNYNATTASWSNWVPFFGRRIEAAQPATDLD